MAICEKCKLTNKIDLLYTQVSNKFADVKNIK